MRAEVERFSKSTSIPCELEVPAGLSVASAQAEHALRMVSEGLANTARHARARRAWVRLRYEGDELVVEVGDDGRGFSPQEAVVRPGHYGLVGLRERARLAGGRLEITSEPGKGSTLHLRLPGIVEARDE